MKDDLRRRYGEERLPRYTSYPTAPQFSADITAETYASYVIGGDSDAKQRLSAEVLGGFKVFIQKNSYLSLAGGVGYLPGFQSASQRGTAFWGAPRAPMTLAIS